MTTPAPDYEAAHARQPAVSRDALQAALVNAHGLLVHLAHVAETAGHVAEAVLAQDAAADLARLMWTDTAA